MKPQRVTILKDTPTINTSMQDIIDAARMHGLETDVMCVPKDPALFDDFIKTTGDILIRRALNKLPRGHKNILINKIRESGRIILNGLSGDMLNIPDKSYQQKIAHMRINVDKIGTYEASDLNALLVLIQSNILHYPFIAKKKVSGEGRGVHMIKTEADISNIESIANSIFQNFIPNTGEYRVYMVGGKAVAFFKKVAGKDTFKNNVSQGGTMSRVTNISKRRHLARLAEKVMNEFPVDFSGIDFLEGVDGKLYFMEINTVPNWDGQHIFKHASKTIGQYIVELGIQLHTNTHSDYSISDLIHHIKTIYDNDVEVLYKKRFHYASRMWLWSQQPVYRKILDKERTSYLKKSVTSTEIYDLETRTLVTEKQKIRYTYFQKYDCQSLNAVLFRYLFAKTIYNTDLSDWVSSQITTQKLLKTFTDLYNDDEAICALSTHAINFFYTALFFLEHTQQQKPTFDPQKLLDIAQTSELYKTNNTAHLSLRIYFLTHMVIGASAFYSRKITEPVYHNVIATLNTIITENYNNVSLDNKLEFLVCATLCEYTTPLKDKIASELLLNQSVTTPYIIDPSFSRARCFMNSEHRNVLAIMAFTPKAN